MSRGTGNNATCNLGEKEDECHTHTHTQRSKFLLSYGVGNKIIDLIRPIIINIVYVC